MTPIALNNESRLILTMARDLMNSRASSLESLRHLRKWLRWEGKTDWADLLKTLEALGVEKQGELRRALSVGQLESKLWLIDVLSDILPRDRAYRFTVVGGWLGILPYLLNKLHPELVEFVQQIDVEPAANRIAEAVNAGLNFEAVDMNALDYDYDNAPDVIVNTSCEHFSAVDLTMWLKRLPAGRYVVLQSNNFFREPTHINCHGHVFALRKSVDLRTYMFTGELDLEKYKRFMVIGITKGL